MFAQSAGAKPDPISGTWTGELLAAGRAANHGRHHGAEVRRQGAVTGTVSGLPNPAEVKAGTFDPKTGALKLQLGKKGDGAVLLVLEGTVVKGTASGKVSGDGAGTFKITKKA